MLTNLYAIYDNKMCEFLPPFLAKNDEVAIRTIKQSSSDKLNYSDYSLYRLGKYDNEDVEKSTHLLTEGYGKVAELTILMAEEG